jgi:hypothetical protein
MDIDFDKVFVIVFIVIVLFIIGGGAYYKKITAENNLTHCNSHYICEKGKMDYQDGQCVCSNVFPISRK